MLCNEVMKMAQKDTQIMVCMTSEFKARLKVQAQKEGRSISNFAYKVIRDYLAKEEKHP